MDFIAPIWKTGAKIYDILDKIQGNREDALELEKRILQPLVTLQHVCQSMSENSKNNIELRQALEQLSLDLQVILKTLTDLKIPNGPWSSSAWFTASGIEKAIPRISNQINHCLQFFDIASGIRLEKKVSLVNHKLDGLKEEFARQLGTYRHGTKRHHSSSSTTVSKQHSELNVKRRYSTSTINQTIEADVKNRNTPPTNAPKACKTSATRTGKCVTTHRQSDLKHGVFGVTYLTVPTNESGEHVYTQPKLKHKTSHLIPEQQPTSQIKHKSSQFTQEQVCKPQLKHKLSPLSTEHIMNGVLHTPLATVGDNLLASILSLSQALDSVKLLDNGVNSPLSAQNTLPKTHRRHTLDTNSTAKKIHEEISQILCLLHGHGNFSFEEIIPRLGQVSVKLGDIGNYHGACEVDRNVVKLLTESRVYEAGRNELLATAYHNYSTHLSSVGRKEEALQSARDSVFIFTQLSNLYSGQPETDANLAMSLNTFAYCLYCSGHTNEALHACHRSVEMYRSLDRQRPGEFRADLAMSMVNYSNRLRSAGKLVDAIQAAKESHNIYGQLYTHSSQAYAPEYASSLGAYSKCLQYLKRHRDALKFTKECIRIRRSLEQLCPNAFTGDLANALQDAYDIYSAMGLHQDAAASVHEAIVLFKKLVIVCPSRFNYELALALSCSAHTHIQQGDYQLGAMALQDAISIFGSLQSEEHNSDYATALDDAAMCRRKLQDFHSAFKFSQMAVEIRRSELAMKWSITNTTSLARSLSGLAACRDALGMRDAVSLQTMKELRDLYQSALSKDNWKDFLPNLAIALHNLSQLQTDLNYHREAAVSAKEATTHLQQLVERHSGKTTPYPYHVKLVDSLINLSFIYTDIANHGDALEAAKRAVKFARLLHCNERRTKLAKAWKRVSYCCLKMGLSEEAREADYNEKRYSR